MNTKRKVLVIGRHPEILEKVKLLLQSNGYNVFGVTENAEAVQVFIETKPEALVIGGGVDLESRNYFLQEFKRINSDVKILDAHPQTILTDLQKLFNT